MKVLAANPSVYGLLAQQTRALNLLLGLLSHENSDISVNVVGLLREWLEPSGIKDAEEEATRTLLDFLFNNQLVHLLTQNLGRLDESNRDEAGGVHASLGTIASG